jgi:lysophospholipase L1-like esterase
MRARARLAPLLLALACACRPAASPPAGPLVVLIGDSTTAGYGGAEGYVVAATPPLATLLPLLPETSPWRHAEVVNLGVPNSTTHDWAVATRPCPEPPPAKPGAPLWSELAVHACRTGAPMVDGVAPLLGRPIDTALVVLGTNDAYRHKSATPEATLANLDTIAARLAPARVLVASPFHATHPARAAFVESLAALMAARGLRSGPDFARIALPLDASGVHLTFGGFVASQALWLDALVPAGVQAGGAPAR